MESPIIENFPEDLLPEIMLRLPVKSLVRFKCVSKSWFSFVSDPNFAKLHFELTAPNNHQLLLKVSLNGFNKAQICSIDLEGSLDEHLANFISPIPSLHVDYIRIVGVCRGFILLAYSLSSMWTPPYLLVWNPSTGVHKTLPLSPIASSFHPRYELEQVCFEYYPSRDDYFVIIAWIEHHYNGRLFRVNCFEFFSIRKNTWRKADTPIRWSSRKQFEFSSFGGNFHWLSIDHTAIIAFNLIERTLSRIPLPLDVFFLDDDLTSLRLEVFEGCLCIISCFGRQSGFAEIWMMKEYKVQSSWIKLDHVPTYAIPHYRFRPIHFTDRAVVGIDDSYIVKVNNRRQLLCCYYHPSCFHQKYYIYAESLLSLPGDGAQA